MTWQKISITAHRKNTRKNSKKLWNGWGFQNTDTTGTGKKHMSNSYTKDFDNNFKKADQAAAKTHKRIVYVSDLFAQIVLALESLARLSEQGLYELSYWIEGMKILPQAASIPACFVALGFDHIPETEEELKQRFRKRAKTAHPDGGGSSEEFDVLKRNYLECQKFLLDNGQANL